MGDGGSDAGFAPPPAGAPAAPPDGFVPLLSDGEHAEALAAAAAIVAAVRGA
jgi:hypothetical protein